MAEQNFHDETADLDEAAEIARTAAVPGSNSTQGAAGAYPDEVMTPRSLNETEEAYLKRRAAANAVDDNAASHQGGIGAQGGQADFGAAGNLAGYDTSKI